MLICNKAYLVAMTKNQYATLCQEAQLRQKEKNIFTTELQKSCFKKT